MIVTVRDGKSSQVFIIIFYSLSEDDDEWQRVQTPIRVDNFDIVMAVSGIAMAISGRTAFVGYYVYEQDQFGVWERADDPFVHTPLSNSISYVYSGGSVNIDGNLACIVGRGYQGSNVNLYRQDSNSKWVRFVSLDDARSCSISGDTIAIKFGSSTKLYNYHQDLNKIVLIQDPIPTGQEVSPMTLIDDYLVFWVRGRVDIHPELRIVVCVNT